MRYAKLGTTGLDVSRVILGCMSWGDASRGWHPWTARSETDEFAAGYRPHPVSGHA